MATSLSDYSQTPASNDLPNYWQTGMPPSKVKNAGWDVMADMCQQMGPGSLVTSGGTANAQTITNTRPLGALYTGRIIEFNPGFTNTGAMTLQEDGLTAKNIFANGVAAIAGMVASGVIARCRYDGTNYQLLNPQESTGSFTGQLTGVVSGGSGTVNYSILPTGKEAYIQVNSAITATSNTTAMTMTGVPASLSSANQKILFILGEDNTTVQMVAVQGLNSTTWAFTVGASLSTGFTGSGTKGLPAGCAFTYSLR